MVKRKAEPIELDARPGARRRTHLSGPLADTQVAEPPSTPRTRDARTPKAAPRTADKPKGTQDLDTRSLKGNDAHSGREGPGVDESDDELLLSPAKHGDAPTRVSPPESPALSRASPQKRRVRTDTDTPRLTRSTADTPSRRISRAAAKDLLFIETTPAKDYTGLNGGYWSRASPTKCRVQSATPSKALSPAKPRKVQTVEEDDLGGYSPPESPTKSVKVRRTYGSAAKRRLPKLEAESPPVSPLEQSSSKTGTTKSKLPRTRAPAKPSRRRPTVPSSASSEKSENDLPSPPESPSKKGKGSVPSAITSVISRRASVSSLSSLPSGAENSDDDPTPVKPPAKVSRVSKAQRATSAIPAVEPAVPPTPVSLPKKLALVGNGQEQSELLPTLKTPSKKRPFISITTVTPSRTTLLSSAPSSPTRLPRVLPTHLHRCLNKKKRDILCALRQPPNGVAERECAEDEDEQTTNELAYEQLSSLLKGTAERGEGNSCLVVGPRGSGKTRIVEQVLRELRPDANSDISRPEPVIIRLSGHAQHNDRLAMREIARQLVQQTGNGASFLGSADDSDAEDDEDDHHRVEGPVAAMTGDDESNPFLDAEAPGHRTSAGVGARLPPTAHLPSLISTLPTLGRPVILVLDAFDLFALHARQALLYCLLDTVQHSQAMGGGGAIGDAKGKGKGKAIEDEVMRDGQWSGLAVVGVTTRVDTLELLEKRVKSRFSGRILRTAGPAKAEDWEALARGALTVSAGKETDDDDTEGEEAEWSALWELAVQKFLQQKKVRDALRETTALVKDVRVFTRIMTMLVLDLTPENPWPSAESFLEAVVGQRCPPRFGTLHALHYPAICLLIAATHARTAGLEQMTFEMLHETFRDQVRSSMAAPVQVLGGGIGMVRCSRGVLMGAFEQLVAMRVFVPVNATPASTGVAREFVKYRCAVEREDVKKAVEKVGQTNLKKWFSKAQ